MSRGQSPSPQRRGNYSQDDRSSGQDKKRRRSRGPDRTSVQNEDRSRYTLKDGCRPRSPNVQGTRSSTPKRYKGAGFSRWIPMSPISMPVESWQDRSQHIESCKKSSPAAKRTRHKETLSRVEENSSQTRPVSQELSAGPQCSLHT